MHIPDGFLDARTMIGTGLISVGAIGTAIRQVGARLRPKQVPLIGLTAAFLFVAQMVNFPVGSGTSGHLVGATLAAVILGPSAGIVVMTCVLIVQAFLFADGGIFSLGANVLNMAVVAPLSGFAVYRPLRSVLRGRRGQLVAAALASWIATVAAATFCAGELAWSGTATWGAVFPPMAAVHMLIGVGEALLTMLILAAIIAGRPDLFSEQDSAAARGTRSASASYAILFAIALLILVVPHASSLPDGLERVAAALGFEHKADVAPVLTAPMGEYRLPWTASAEVSVTIAALVGACAVFLSASFLARVLLPRKASASAQNHGEQAG